MDWFAFQMGAVSDLLGVVDDIYAAAEEPARWRALPGRIAPLIGAHAFCVQRQSFPAPRCDAVAASGLPQAALADYYAQWDERNPWRRRGLAHVLNKPASARWKALHMSRFAPPAEIRSADIFARSLAPMDIYDCIAMPLEVEPQAMWIAFFCDRRKDLFSENDIAAAEAIAPHLGRAARMTAANSTARRYLGEGAVADFGAPALVLSRAGEVIETNATFRETIGAKVGSRFRLGDKDIRQAIEEFLNDKRGAKRAPTCAIETGTEWRIRLYRLDDLGALIGGRSGDENCLILFERVAPKANDAGLLKRRFDLTDAEADIASLLLDGMTPAQIAAARKCSISTVRWHLRQVYSKLGVTSKRGLELTIGAA